MAAAVTPGPTLSRTRSARPPATDGEESPSGRPSGPAPGDARAHDCGAAVGRLVQANRGFLDDAATPLAADVGFHRFAGIGSNGPTPGRGAV